MAKKASNSNERIVHHCPICDQPIKVGWRPTEPHMGKLLALGGGDDNVVWIVTEKCKHLTIDGGQGNAALDALFAQRSFTE